jgi:hypothetical protein
LLKKRFDPVILSTAKNLLLPFGSITRFVAEDESPAMMLEFTRRREGLQKTVWQSAVPGAEPATRPAAHAEPDKAARGITEP